MCIFYGYVFIKANGTVVGYRSAVVSMNGFDCESAEHRPALNRSTSLILFGLILNITVLSYAKFQKFYE